MNKDQRYRDKDRRIGGKREWNERDYLKRDHFKRRKINSPPNFNRLHPINRNNQYNQRHNFKGNNSSYRSPNNYYNNRRVPYQKQFNQNDNFPYRNRKRRDRQRRDSPVSRREGRRYNNTERRYLNDKKVRKGSFNENKRNEEQPPYYKKRDSPVYQNQTPNIQNPPIKPSTVGGETVFYEREKKRKEIEAPLFPEPPTIKPIAISNVLEQFQDIVLPIEKKKVEEIPPAKIIPVDFKKKTEDRKNELKKQGEDMDDIMKVIRKCDEDITNYKIEIEKKIKLLQDEERKKNQKEDDVFELFRDDYVSIGNIVEDIYYENRKKSVESHFDFHHLYNYQDFIDGKYNKPMKIEDYTDYKKNDDFFIQNYNRIEKEIKKVVDERDELYRKNAKIYKETREKYEEKDQKENGDSKGFPVIPKRRKNIIPHSEITEMIPRDEQDFVFESKNSVIVDPILQYKIDGIRHNSWSEQEVDIFFEKFAIYPKELRRISTFLPNKSVSDLVHFYYHVKVSKRFKKLMVSLKRKKKYKKKFMNVASQKGRNVYGKKQISGRTSLNSLSRLDFDNKVKKVKNGKTSDRTVWSKVEQSDFQELLRRNGKNFSKISRGLVGKTVSQCKNFFNNNKTKLNLDKIMKEHKKEIKRREKNKKDRENNGNYSFIKDVDSYWTEKEHSTFMKYFEKEKRDFSLISSKFDNKTENEVVEHYNHIKYEYGLISKEKRDEKIEKNRVWSKILEDSEKGDKLDDLKKLSNIATLVDPKTKGSMTVEKVEKVLKLKEVEPAERPLQLLAKFAEMKLDHIEEFEVERSKKEKRRNKLIKKRNAVLDVERKKKEKKEMAEKQETERRRMLVEKRMKEITQRNLELNKRNQLQEKQKQLLKQQQMDQLQQLQKQKQMQMRFQNQKFFEKQKQIEYQKQKQKQLEMQQKNQKLQKQQEKIFHLKNQQKQKMFLQQQQQQQLLLKTKNFQHKPPLIKPNLNIHHQQQQQQLHKKKKKQQQILKKPKLKIKKKTVVKQNLEKKNPQVKQMTQNIQNIKEKDRHFSQFRATSQKAPITQRRISRYSYYPFPVPTNFIGTQVHYQNNPAMQMYQNYIPQLQEQNFLRQTQQMKPKQQHQMHVNVNLQQQQKQQQQTRQKIQNQMFKQQQQQPKKKLNKQQLFKQKHQQLFKQKQQQLLMQNQKNQQHLQQQQQQQQKQKKKQKQQNVSQLKKQQLKVQQQKQQQLFHQQQQQLQMVMKKQQNQLQNKTNKILQNQQIFNNQQIQIQKQKQPNKNIIQLVKKNEQKK